MLDRTKVLVVDDEKVVCESCRRALVEEGYEVSTSTDARQGLERAQNEDFELVILDLKMPGISGLQVLRGIKERKPRTVVIMITAYPTAESAVKSGRFGAVDYLLKPFTPDELSSKVREAIRVSEEDIPNDGLHAEEPISVAAERKHVSPPGQVLVLGAFEQASAIHEIAESEGCSIETAYDAEGMLERIRTGEVEVLIIGGEFLGKEALELIRLVRGIKENITVITVSSDQSNEFARQVGEQGVFFCLVEPFGAPELKAVLRGAARKVGSSGKLARAAQPQGPTRRGNKTP